MRYHSTILKQFRQWGRKTPGHPEFGHTAGVAMGVGMAMAEAHLSSVYNRENFPLIDHYTYAICGDGDLMEGVSTEAASLAGDLQLGKLILIYDSNNITLDGEAFKYKALLFFYSVDWSERRSTPAGVRGR